MHSRVDEHTSAPLGLKWNTRAALKVQKLSLDMVVLYDRTVQTTNHLKIRLHFFFFTSPETTKLLDNHTTQPFTSVVLDEAKESRCRQVIRKSLANDNDGAET